VIRVNNVLRRLGLAREAPTDAKSESPFFVDRRPKPRTIKVPALLSRYRTSPLIRPAALLVKRVVRRALGLQLTSAGAPIDRVHSRAFSPTDSSFAVYGRDLEEATIERIRAELASLRLPGGEPVLDGVFSI